jgi:solute carrier family 25 citrate transporter 1
MPIPETKQKDIRSAPAPWKSLVAGATAGGIEGFATYPFEYAKTMMQFAPDGKTPDGKLIVRVPSLLLFPSYMQQNTHLS